VELATALGVLLVTGGFVLISRKLAISADRTLRYFLVLCGFLVLGGTAVQIRQSELVEHAFRNAPETYQSVLDSTATLRTAARITSLSGILFATVGCAIGIEQKVSWAPAALVVSLFVDLFVLLASCAPGGFMVGKTHGHDRAPAANEAALRGRILTVADA
jgi:hypothetical protein